MGRRSGFAFGMDPTNHGRKVLIAVRGANAIVNNYYDGPFDQLADNYVEQTNISKYLELASPNLKGRIDKYGYYTDRATSSRVAVSPYYVYFSEKDLLWFWEAMSKMDDPIKTVSQRGRNLITAMGTPTPPITYPGMYPTVYPTPYVTPYPTPTATPIP